MGAPTCVFVIIGYNNGSMTEACVMSFRTHIRGVPLWLYDNASNPSLKPIADKFGLPYLRSETNLGFSGGANRAIDWIIDEANPAILCLVNNDILVTHSFARSLPAEISAFTRDEHLAAMTPLLFIDPLLQHPENFGILYYQSGLAFQNRTGMIQKDVLLNGAFLFLKASICKQLTRQDGFVFRPSYFFNAEDVELSLRLLSRGFKLHVNPNLAVQHLGSQSSRGASTQSFRLAWRNLLWTLFLTRSNAQLLRDAFFVVAGQVLLIALSIRRGHPELVLGLWAETLRSGRELASWRQRFLALKHREFRDSVRGGVFPRGRGQST